MKYVRTLGLLFFWKTVGTVTIGSIERLVGDYRTIAPNQSTNKSNQRQKSVAEFDEDKARGNSCFREKRPITPDYPVVPL